MAVAMTPSINLRAKSGSESIKLLRAGKIRLIDFKSNKLAIADTATNEKKTIMMSENKTKVDRNNLMYGSAVRDEMFGQNRSLGSGASRVMQANG